MKKIIVTSVIVLAIAGFVWYEHANNPVAVMPTENNLNPAATTETPTTGSSGNTPKSPVTKPKTSTTTVQTPTTAQGAYKDGTYTGPVTDAIYGNMQVAVTILAGKISDVKFIEYPNEAGHTVQLSQQVMPVLRSEAINAQSASVNMISGATQTVTAFKQSLAAALAMAKN